MPRRIRRTRKAVVPPKNPKLLAEQYLASLDSRTQERGEAFYRQHRAQMVKASSDRTWGYKVKGDTGMYDVKLRFTETGGWINECTCPVGHRCKHIYVALKSLMETEPLEPQPVGPPLRTKKPTSKDSPDTNLIAAFERKTGRGLATAERNFVKKLQKLYHENPNAHRLAPYTLEKLGFPIKGDWGKLVQIAPARPANERLFWLFLATAMRERGLAIPAFMEPISDATEIEPELKKWRRIENIFHWTDVLQKNERYIAWETNPPTPFEVRLRFSKDGATMEWRRFGVGEFEAFGSGGLRQVMEDMRNNTVRLTPEGEWIWEIVKTRSPFLPPTHVLYSEQSVMDKLSRLFDLPSFDRVLVNEEGQPFAKPSEPLRWQMNVPETLEGDYRIRVVQSDGSPVPEIYCVLRNSTPLFVTKEAVFRGPRLKGEAVDPRRETVIPAPALETAHGAALLHALGIELPPRLRERTQVVRLQTVISCDLQEPRYVGAAETCHITASAKTDDGTKVLEWAGSYWATPKGQAPYKPASGAFTVIDHSGLRDPRSLLAGTDVKWDGYANNWSLKVSKRFPEVFEDWLKSTPPDVKVDLQGELSAFRDDVVAGGVRLQATESEMDWFDLRVVVNVSDATLTEEEINLLLNARGGYVRLKGKGWRRLKFDLNPEEDEQLARLGLTARELSAEPQRLHALQLGDAAARKFLPEPQFEKIQLRVQELKTRVTPEHPASVKASLRPYQTEGFHFLAYLAENRFGGILADDMGLGKTLQTLTWLAWLRERRGDGAAIAPVLVVCPKSVMDNWSAEAKRFTPTLRTKVWKPSELDGLLKARNEADLHVINYNQLRQLGEGLATVRWLAVVLDEGQYIKNPSSQTAQVARSLQSDHRLILSGTPIENQLLDLWSLMTFAMPGVLGSRNQFAKIYDAKEDPHARRRLSARVRPFLLRRTKNQVAKDLPDRIEEDLFCEIEGEQQTLYRAELKRAQQMLLGIKTPKQLAEERFNFLTSLLRLRQICCHPRLVKPDSVAPSAKVEALLEQLEPLVEEGHKVLIFSQFVEMLDILREEIRKRDWPAFYLTGSTEDRGALVNRFQQADGTALFLISLKAGGFGLNLTAASYVVLFDPWWNPAVENQAIDRTHRIGQKQNVIAYRLLIKNSIEEKIRLLQKAKSSLAEDVLGEEKFAQALTLDDLKFLLSDTP